MKEVWKVLFALGVVGGSTSSAVLGFENPLLRGESAKGAGGCLPVTRQDIPLHPSDRGNSFSWNVAPRRAMKNSSESLRLGQNHLRPISAGNVTSPRLCIRVYNVAEVPPATLRRAIKEADRVFQQAGIEVGWAECLSDNKNAAKTQGCEQPTGPLMLSVRILFDPEKARPVAQDAFFGAAEPYDRGGVEATLFYEHIDTFARSGGASPSVVLGHALAHEVGHLLLWTKSHSSRGVMKASRSKQDLQAIEQGKLVFSPEEAESMKANLFRRQKHYEMIMTSGGSVR